MPYFDSETDFISTRTAAARWPLTLNSTDTLELRQPLRDDGVRGVEYLALVDIEVIAMFMTGNIELLSFR